MQLSPTHRASFSIGSEIAAKRVVDVLTEVFFDGDAAVAAFERPNGQWDVALHFARRAGSGMAARTRCNFGRK